MPKYGIELGYINSRNLGIPEHKRAVEEYRLNQDIILQLSQCNDLPNRPSVAMRILELTKDPNSTFAQVAETIHMDPALSAKVIRSANSPFYGRIQNCRTVRDAIRLFGLEGTLTIALSFSLVGSFQGLRRCPIDHSLFWRRSILSAAYARTLAKQIRRLDYEEFFLCALLQDIGMLALAQAFPEQYAKLAAMQLDHTSLREAEKEIFESDHAEVGAWFLNNWQLPEYICQGVAGSHELKACDSDDHDQMFKNCIAISGLIADIWLMPEWQENMQNTINYGSDIFKLSSEQFGAILGSIGPEIPGLESLFDTDLLDLDASEQLLDQAWQVLSNQE